MKVSPKILKLITLILFIGLIVLAAVYIILPKLKREGQEATKVVEEGGTESIPETAPLAVEASPARRADLVMRISATGLTEAIRQVVITPKLGGEIAELPVSEGQFVKKGELLMKLDDREYQLALAEAQDALLDAQVEYGLLLREGEGERGRQGDMETGRQGEEGERGHSRDWEVARAGWEEAREKYRKGEISDAEYENAKLKWETAQIFSGEKRHKLIANKSGLSKDLVGCTFCKGRVQPACRRWGG